MQGIQHQGQITSIVAKVDGSLGYRVATPELSAEEKATFFELQNQNCSITIQPESAQEEIIEIKGEISEKTQSQRIRANIFVLWKLAFEKGKTKKSAEQFYRDYTERLIYKIQNDIESLQ